MTNFASLIQEQEFRAIYFELLYLESKLALESACKQLGTVQLGVETADSKVQALLEVARNSQEFKEKVYNKDRNIPPRDLFLWLLERLGEYRSEIANLPEQTPEGTD